MAGSSRSWPQPGMHQGLRPIVGQVSRRTRRSRTAPASLPPMAGLTRWRRRRRMTVIHRRRRRRDHHVHRVDQAALHWWHFWFCRWRLGDEKVDGGRDKVSPAAPCCQPKGRQVDLRRRLGVQRTNPADATKLLLCGGNIPGMGWNTTELDIDEVRQHSAVCMG